MSFVHALRDAAKLIETRLAAEIATLPASNIRDAMAYAAQGGKRLRGFLTLETALLHDVSPNRAIFPAMAIEAMHAYSLVHDDMPCMDDDDLRRGRPTVHIQWDEATAVLTGDALQAFAFEMVSHPDTGSGDVRADLTRTLAHAAGASGMVLGQAIDIAAETADHPLTLAEITALQDGKTGALIEWSACAGPRLAGADIAPLRRYAQALGLAFQIADDILDVTGDAAKAGKRLQKDAEAGKATFVSLLGLNGAQTKARDLVSQACDALEPYGQAAETLRETAQFVISRDT